MSTVDNATTTALGTTPPPTSTAGAPTSTTMTNSTAALLSTTNATASTLLSTVANLTTSLATNATATATTTAASTLLNTTASGTATTVPSTVAPIVSTTLAPFLRAVNHAGELPSPTGGTWAAVVAAILFVLGFIAATAMYYRNVQNQEAERRARRKDMQADHSTYGGTGAFSPTSSSGCPMAMSTRSALRVMEFDDSRGSTPEFDVHAANQRSQASTSFRLPSSPIPEFVHTGYQPPRPQSAAPTQVRSAMVASTGSMRGQSYFVDSDEELLDSSRRDRSTAPFVGGARVHVTSVSARNFFDDT